MKSLKRKKLHKKQIGSQNHLSEYAGDLMLYGNIYTPHFVQLYVMFFTFQAFGKRLSGHEANTL